MATARDYMNLGVSSPLARRLPGTGTLPVATSVGGSSSGSAVGIGGNNYKVFITASNTGSGALLPQVGGQLSASAGALLGDEFWITNGLSATIAIYAANTAAGSAVTLYGQAASVAGTTGVSIGTGQTGIFTPFTASTWLYIRSSV